MSLLKSYTIEELAGELVRRRDAGVPATPSLVERWRDHRFYQQLGSARAALLAQAVARCSADRAELTR